MLSSNALLQGLKHHGSPKFKAWLGAVDMSEGVNAKDATAAVDTAILAKVVSETKDKLGKSLATLSVAKGLTAFAKVASESSLTILVSFDKDSGKASYVLGSASKTRKSTEREGATAKGSMSTRLAVVYGNKNGDSIDFDTQIEKVAKETPGLSQRGVLFRDFNASEAVAKMRTFGYTS